MYNTDDEAEYRVVVPENLRSPMIISINRTWDDGINAHRITSLSRKLTVRPVTLAPFGPSYLSVAQ